MGKKGTTFTFDRIVAGKAKALGFRFDPPGPGMFFKGGALSCRLPGGQFMDRGFGTLDEAYEFLRGFECALAHSYEAAGSRVVCNNALSSR